MEYVMPVWVFLVGLSAGSFLNVCIYRLPNHISVIKPGSMCTACGTPVKFYDNIPVLSYFYLKGKCRTCGEPFSIKYPGVELLAGLLSLYAWYRFGVSLDTLAAMLFIFILIPVIFIDIEHHIIPNSLIIAGIAASLIVRIAGYFTDSDPGLFDFLFGTIMGAGFLTLSALLGRLLFRKESMGMGDIKLGLVMGMFLGLRDVVISLFLAFLFAGIFGGIYIFLTRNKTGGVLPFGPFLAFGSIGGLFFGEKLADIYLNWVFM